MRVVVVTAATVLIAGLFAVGMLPVMDSSEPANVAVPANGAPDSAPIQDRGTRQSDSAAGREDEDERLAQAKRTNFVLELHVPRRRVRLGEPVVLIVSLQNQSRKAQRVRDLLSPEYGFLAVWVKRPAEKREIVYSPPVRSDGRATRPRPLGPGKRLTDLVPLYLTSRGWLLERPGVYRVRAEYAIGDIKVSSKSVTFEVIDVAQDRR